jgi:hypothetical protein
MLVLEPKTPWWYTNAASSPVSIGVHHNVLFDCHGNLIQFSFQFKFWIHGNKNIEYFFTCSIIFHYLSFNNTLSYPRPHTNLNLVSLLLWILIWLSLGIQKKKKGDLSSFLLISICFFITTPWTPYWPTKFTNLIILHNILADIPLRWNTKNFFNLYHLFINK